MEETQQIVPLIDNGEIQHQPIAVFVQNEETNSAAEIDSQATLG